MYQCCVRGENEAIMLLGVGLWTSWVNISGERISLYGKDARIGTIRYGTSQQERGPANVKNTRKKLIVVGPARDISWIFRRPVHTNSY